MTFYTVRYLCVACGDHREVRSKAQIKQSTHRRCAKCKRDAVKVTYIGVAGPSGGKKSEDA